MQSELANTKCWAGKILQVYGMELYALQGTPTPKRVDVEIELLKYSRTEFKLEELKQKSSLPEGVDPSKLETYLSEQEFKVQWS